MKIIKPIILAFPYIVLGVLLGISIGLQYMVLTSIYTMNDNVSNTEALISSQELECPQSEVIQPQIVGEDHFTDRVNEYANFITTIGPLLQEYPEMIQLMMIFQLADNSNLLVIPGDKLESLIPLPD